MNDEQLTPNFKASEFACKCGCGLSAVSPHLVQKLQRVRSRLGYPMVITSGMRCSRYNGKLIHDGVKASEYSKHLYGYAADIECRDSKLRDTLVGLLRTEFERIGISKTFIHVDIDHSSIHPAMWVY